MKTIRTKSLFKWAALLAVALILFSCQEKPEPVVPQPDTETPKPSQSAEHALVLYSAGFNNLSGALSENIGTLKKGFIPGMHDNKMLFILEHHTVDNSRDYKNRTTPTLYRLYKDEDGVLKEEIVLKLFTSTYLTDPNILKSVFDELNRIYDIQTWGMIFSSHSSGYLPKSYLENEFNFENGSIFNTFSQTPYKRIGTTNEELGLPLTKSLGADAGASAEYVEMDFIEFCQHLPVHFEYILFDSCLMGGIEVMYELKDKCDVVGASPTEVMAKGINYTNITDHIFNGEGYGLTEISKEYIAQYKAPGEPYPYATWVLVDTRNLEALADRCAVLFEDYRKEMEKIDKYEVQRFFYVDHRHFHYDFLDILRQVCNPQELAEVEELLNNCILYKDATDLFIGLRINTYSGLSMMLPVDARDYLKDYYKKLAWNQRTNLVK